MEDVALMNSLNDMVPLPSLSTVFIRLVMRPTLSPSSCEDAFRPFQAFRPQTDSFQVPNRITAPESDSGPLSSRRSPQAALKFYCRSDRVTRD